MLDGMGALSDKAKDLLSKAGTVDLEKTFGDFATEGYLRNFEKEKDLAIVKRAEMDRSRPVSTRPL